MAALGVNEPQVLGLAQPVGAHAEGLVTAPAAHSAVVPPDTPANQALAHPIQ
jgi:hypothetical protein